MGSPRAQAGPSSGVPVTSTSPGSARTSVRSGSSSAARPASFHSATSSTARIASSRWRSTSERRTRCSTSSTTSRCPAFRYLGQCLHRRRARAFRVPVPYGFAYGLTRIAPGREPTGLSRQGGSYLASSCLAGSRHVSSRCRSPTPSFGASWGGGRRSAFQRPSIGRFPREEGVTCAGSPAPSGRSTTR